LAYWPAGQVSATAVHEVAVRGIQSLPLFFCRHFASALGGHGHSGAREPEGSQQFIFPKSMKGRLPEDRSLPLT
jgi:hypothetical protein